MSLTRRTFLIGAGSTGLGICLGRLSHLFPLESPQMEPDWRPGDEAFVPSTCLLCPAHCGILGRVVDGNLVRISGNPIHPVSRGGLCPKGVAAIQMLYHPARLRGPLERRGTPGANAFVASDWGAALERVAAEIRGLRSGGRLDAMACLAGDVRGSMNDVIERFLAACGSPHLIRESYTDGSGEVMALSQGVAAAPAFDLARSDFVLSFGAPMSEAWWCLPQAATSRSHSLEAHSRWVQLDTRLSRTAAAADRWLPVHPDSYGLLALSIAYVLLKEGMYDLDWVAGHVSGFEDGPDADGSSVPGYRSLVLRHGRPEETSRRIGLGVEEIVRLAKDFGRARRPVAVWDQVVTWRRGGFSDALAIHALNVLTGSVQRPGGVYVQPPLPIPTLDELAPAPGAGTDPGPSTLHEADWVDRVLAAERSPIDILFLYRANPVASLPQPERVREALARIPLVVSFSPFLDESARFAHLVLPDHTFLERWQDAPAPACVPYPVWGLIQPVVPPLYDTRASGDVLLDLAERLGGDVAAALPWSSMEDLVQARGEALAAAKRGSAFVQESRRDELREMESRGWWIPHNQEPGDFWKSLRAAGGWFDPFHEDRGPATASRLPDGRTALFPVAARRRLAPAGKVDEVGFLPGALATDEDGGGQRGHPSKSLRLLPYRVMTLASGTTPLMPWLMERLGPLVGKSWEHWVEVHPETAREWKVQDGQRIRVVSEHGSFVSRLCVFEGAQPGVLNTPYGLHSCVEGWGSFDPVNPLVAVGELRDPVTGLPDWYSTRVRIEVV